MRFAGGSVKRQEVAEEFLAVFGEDAFGMELDAPNGEFPVTQSHDFALVGFGGDLQAIGKAIAIHDERMVASSREGVGNILKEFPAVVFYRGSFTVHHAVVDFDLRLERMSDALVSQADAQDGQNARPSLDDGVGLPRHFRRAGARRNQNPFQVQGLQLGQVDFVVAHDGHLGAHFAQVLHQVVGKRIVVVDDQHHAQTGPSLPDERGEVNFKSHGNRRSIERALRARGSELNREANYRAVAFFAILRSKCSRSGRAVVRKVGNSGHRDSRNNDRRSSDLVVLGVTRTKRR